MVSHVITATVQGIEPYKIDVEIDLVQSIPGITIVGLPDTAVNEAKERVRSAIKNAGFLFPNKKVVINLAPADLKKEGTNYDLPMAMGVLAEDGILDGGLLKDTAFIGELSLDGSLRAVNGILPIVAGLKDFGVKTVIVPEKNAKEAALIPDICVLSAKRLEDVVNHFSPDENCRKPLERCEVDIEDYLNEYTTTNYPYDFKDIKGQAKAKKALEISAAGGHNLLMTGPPGSGKTLLSKTFASILPPLELEEAIELTKIYSVSGMLEPESPLVNKRPFRSVHHSASAVGIIGGGSHPKPGEITLAHRGVLFLDEIVEFPRNVLEVLRQPLEDGQVTISRVQGSQTFPCEFMLVCAMNPCPCGWYGDPSGRCTCSQAAVDRYLSRISGPMLDRVDMIVEVSSVKFDELRSRSEAEPSSAIKARVDAARSIQNTRYSGTSTRCNAYMQPAQLRTFCQLDEDCTALMKQAFDALGMTARSYDRVLKVARTIADLAGSDQIRPEHIAEAVQYRSFQLGGENAR